MCPLTCSVLSVSSEYVFPVLIALGCFFNEFGLNYTTSCIMSLYENLKVDFE
jgi:hypothetical protein